MFSDNIFSKAKPDLRPSFVPCILSLLWAICGNIGSTLAQPGGGDIHMVFRIYEGNQPILDPSKNGYAVFAVYKEREVVHNQTKISEQIFRELLITEHGYFHHHFPGSGIGLPRIPFDFKFAIVHESDTMWIHDSYYMDSIVFRKGHYLRIPPSNYMNEIRSKSGARISGDFWDIANFEILDEPIEEVYDEERLFGGERIIDNRYHEKPLADTKYEYRRNKNLIALYSNKKLARKELYADQYQFISSNAPSKFNLSDLHFDTPIQKQDSYSWDKQPLLSFAVQSSLTFVGSIALIKLHDVDQRNRIIRDSYRLYISKDNGYSWEQIMVDFKTDFQILVFGNKALVSSPKNHVLIDGQGQMTTTNLKTGVYPVSLFFESDNLGFMVTYHQLYKTNDGGKTWRNLLSGISATDLLKDGSQFLISLQDYGFRSYGISNDCYLYSNDAGETWSFISYNPLKEQEKIPRNTASQAQLFFRNDTLVKVDLSGESDDGKRLYLKESRWQKLVAQYRMEEAAKYRNGMLHFRYFNTIRPSTYYRSTNDTLYQERLTIGKNTFKYEPFLLEHLIKNGGEGTKNLYRERYRKGLIEGTYTINDSMIIFKPSKDTDWLNGKYFYGYGGKTLSLYSAKDGHRLMLVSVEGEWYKGDEKVLDLSQEYIQHVYSFTPEKHKISIRVVKNRKPIEYAKIYYGKQRVRPETGIPGGYYLDKRMLTIYRPDRKYYKTDLTGVDLRIKYKHNKSILIPFKMSGNHVYELNEYRQ